MAQDLAEGLDSDEWVSWILMNGPMAQDLAEGVDSDEWVS